MKRDNMSLNITNRMRDLKWILSFNPSVMAESMHDVLARPGNDPGFDAAIEGVTDWILRAQDNSVTADGGVAAYYSLRTGWSSSYPETTGYIVPTLLAVSSRYERSARLASVDSAR
jgi:hypothetical protein